MFNCSVPDGVTTVIFESTPVYPTPSRFWEVVAKHKLTQVRPRLVEPTLILDSSG